MKIKHIKLYQAAKFAGTQQSYFNSEAYVDKTQVSTVHTVNLEKTDCGILIWNDADCIEVYHTNIAFVQYDSGPTTKKASKELKSKEA